MSHCSLIPRHAMGPVNLGNPARSRMLELTTSVAGGTRFGSEGVVCETCQSAIRTRRRPDHHTSA